MTEKVWQDEERLRKEYVHKQRSSNDLADEWGCSGPTVRRWVRKFGFSKYKRLPSPTTVPESGTIDSYERVANQYNGTTDSFLHHRLLAVAIWGYDSVCDNDVHHVNGIPWDNRPENLELVSHERHAQIHNETVYVDGNPWYSRENLAGLYVDKEYSTSEIAEKYDVTADAVRQHMKKHGINRRSKLEAQNVRYAGDD
jgi:transposase-like protein